MKDLLDIGRMLSTHARLSPARIGVRDLEREMTFAQWNARACRFANALAGLGLRKGDRVAVLAYNCVEWAEIYVGAAKAGLVVVPINFRLVGPEVRFIVRNAEAAAIVVQDELAGVVAEIRRVIGAGPAYLTFDVDGIDPSQAPGTGTPEIGGYSTFQAQQMLRGLMGLDLIGADVVEVSPPFDPTDNTALVGATMMFEILCLVAAAKVARRGG